MSIQANAQVKKTTTPKKTPATTAAKKTTAPVNKVAATKSAVKPDLATAGSIRIKIVTDSGTMFLRLYDSTPLHRDNFVKLVKQGFYDSLLFHRVIQGFMIQGGDPLSKNAAPGQPLGMGGGDMERIPAEFRNGIIHKRGALAAARDGNPQKASSACQFYIVQGKRSTDAELGMIEQRSGVKYTEEQREIYKSMGGTPFLDHEYTVFGEVETGLEVIDKIASVAKAPGDRPIGDIRMHIEIVNE
ncbi:MAG: peptidylprolyl isomerase [Bacteroidetes bacterium]|nr:peptidylprolyl isomerase [Bacteroidota bacterium]